MHSLEPFLLMLSSVFVPLYSVILTRLDGSHDSPALVTAQKVNDSGVAIWFAGIACDHRFA